MKIAIGLLVFAILAVYVVDAHGKKVKLEEDTLASIDIFQGWIKIYVKVQNPKRIRTTTNNYEDDSSKMAEDNNKASMVHIANHLEDDKVGRFNSDHYKGGHNNKASIYHHVNESLNICADYNG
uniref:Cathepsin propeptide inhibitor domain-containing protein n=1 Tax=Anopheles culicifacies TaxID=139723 RepID=A0A182M9R3_9DIPT